MNTEPRNCGRELKDYPVPTAAAAAGLQALSGRRGREAAVEREAAVGRSAVRVPPRGCRSLRRLQHEGARGGAGRLRHHPVFRWENPLPGGAEGRVERNLTPVVVREYPRGKAFSGLRGVSLRCSAWRASCAWGCGRAHFPRGSPPVSLGSVARPRVSAEATRRRALSASCCPPPWSRIAGCRWRPTPT